MLRLNREDLPVLALLFVSMLVLSPGPAAAVGRPAATGKPAPNAPPNILLVIMDDVGIDQMRIFGYGGGPLDSGAPRTPNIDAVAQAGVSFRNSWAMT